MVTVHSYAAKGRTTSLALSEIDKKIEKTQLDSNLVYAFYGCNHAGSTVHGFLRSRFPQAAILGGTSCLGVMNQTELGGADSIGLLAIDDADGNYGVASTRLSGNISRAAGATLNQALANAGCPGELPELVWIYQAPGNEEAVIEGLRSVVGDRCPIIGGSSADDSVSGNWQQLCNEGVMSDGLVVGAVFSSGGIGYAFEGGYEPTGANGIVTGVSPNGGPVGSNRSGRKITSIDGRPAASIYDEWTGHHLGSKVVEGGNVLMDTTMFPIATDAGAVGGVPRFRLIHPESITPDRAICTFAEVSEGERVFCMRGDKTRLIQRAGRVAAEAVSMIAGGSAHIAGGLMVYCAGCMLAVGDRMQDVSDEIRHSFTDAPFLTCFTFGEQGRLVDQNVHGNLMISAVVFGQ